APDLDRRAGTGLRRPRSPCGGYIVDHIDDGGGGTARRTMVTGGYGRRALRAAAGSGGGSPPRTREAAGGGPAARPAGVAGVGSHGAAHAMAPPRATG